MRSSELLRQSIERFIRTLCDIAPTHVKFIIIAWDERTPQAPYEGGSNVSEIAEMPKAIRAVHDAMTSASATVEYLVIQPPQDHSEN